MSGKKEGEKGTKRHRRFVLGSFDEERTERREA
jgi:hypothetical protein